MKRGLWWAVGGLVLIALAAGGYRLLAANGDQAKFKLAKVERGPLTAAVAAAGTLNPVSAVQVGSQISGQLKEILVDFNSPVTAGQLIARIDPETYQHRVRQAEADLEATRSSVNVQRAQEYQAQINLDEAQRDYERKTMLVEKNFISPADRDKARTTRDAARAQLQLTQAQVKNSEALVRQREAQLAQARVDLGRTEIRSPVNGIVVKRSVEPGQTVAASLQAPELFVIARNLTDMQVETSIDEADVGRVRVGHPIGEFSRAVLSYRLDRYDISDVDPDAAREIRDQIGENWASVIGLVLNRDTTNRPFNPSSGTDTTLSLEFGGGILQGDADFIKPIIDYHYYQELLFKGVFHFRGQMGFAFRNFTDEEVPTFERFFLGGLNSVRGYKGRRISPRDPETGDRIGGTRELFVNFEYIHPIAQDLGLHAVVFFDAGNAWVDDQMFFEQTNASDENVPLGLFKSFGGGLRWLSPLGPLRLEYGVPLDRLKDSNRAGRFEFSMGTTF